MKRLGSETWDLICDPENIERAWRAAMLKGRNQRKWGNQHDALIPQIIEELRTETYQFSPYKEMVVYEPKERIIHYPEHIIPTVLHKCLLNVVGKRITNYISRDSYANIKGRGLHRAVGKLQKFANAHPDWYYFKGDVRKFFMNVDHELMKLAIRKIIKCKKTLRFCDLLIDSFEMTPGKGLPIGNHTSPYFANLFLADLTRYIKEQYGVKLMLVYMDDIVCAFETKSEAMEFKNWYEDQLHQLKLELKNNWRVDKLENGVDFLGCVVRPTHTRLRKRIKKNLKKKSKRVSNLPNKDFKLQMASYWGWCKTCNARHLLKSVWGQEKFDLFDSPSKHN